MTVLGVLAVGATGLNIQSDNLDVISTNISNSSTTGYKQGEISFSDLLDGKYVTPYAPGGVRIADRKVNNTQGDISGNNQPTNMAISGKGFFAVKEAASGTEQMYYTRDGTFTADGNGFLKNAAGFYLQGWPLDVAGNLPPAVEGYNVSSDTAIANLKTVSVNNLEGLGQATSYISMQANLYSDQAIYTGTPVYSPTSNTANMASGTVPAHFTVTSSVVDDKGLAHEIDFTFLKTANNTWATEVYAKPAQDVTGSATGQIAYGNVQFNGDGTLASVDDSLKNLTINWSNGANPSSIAINYGTAGQMFGTPGAVSVGRGDGLSQLSGSYNIRNVTNNGFQSGGFVSASIDSNGYLIGKYNNGVTRKLFQIPLAEFPDSDQLKADSRNVYIANDHSGSPAFVQSLPGGLGTIIPQSTEGSNVDISLQLTNLIAAQQSYQFNSKLVSTGDTMLQNLVQM